MTRSLAWLTAVLTATIGFLIGIVVTGPLATAPIVVAPPEKLTGVFAGLLSDRAMPVGVPGAPGTVNFADVAERLNPAVVNIDATARGRRVARNRVDGQPPRPELFQDPYDRRTPGNAPRRGTGTGFFIDEAGHILTNHHVIEGAERITVKLNDGRSFRATVIGSDPDTDIALMKVEAATSLPHATLGNSDTLRVGEWVCAIGNPLAYEHTVTVGVVSFMGRKLFDAGLDNYIQTDAAISFGNSGGPLINARGEVIGINSAISRQASNIGFAVPINQARAILPQLKTLGRVSRGFMGVTLRDVDPDLQEALKLPRSDGALVQNVADGSPGSRAGIRPYDLIISVDREPVRGNDSLIREIASRKPGTMARLEFVRDGRPREVAVKLAERPARPSEAAVPASPAERSLRQAGPGELGLSLIEIDETNAHRFDVPSGMTGLLVQRIEPLSAADDAGLERGQVILELNRHAVDSVAEFRRMVNAARAGDVLVVMAYDPSLDQRAIYTVRTEPR